METGHFMPVLHAHLPYVRHPEHEFFLEENWLYEAATDCYIPLAHMLNRLIDDRVEFAITISLSPTLLMMLSDPLLMSRLRRHMVRLITLCEAEQASTSKSPPSGSIAAMYAARFKETLRVYDEELGGNLVSAFRRLSSHRGIEIITTSATHAYLPNLSPVPEAIDAQIEAGMRIFQSHMGYAPAGLWLPECGYYPGIERHVTASGAGYFFLEAHGVLHASPRPRYGIHRPVACPGGAVAFGRDPFAANKVWSAESGYPADPIYRDFHSDLGFESTGPHMREHLAPFLHDGESGFTGLKHKRITGEGMEKLLYKPAPAMRMAQKHARDFVAALEAHANGIHQRYGFAPLITAPYDAELFGHWWFEGIPWLNAVLRRMHKSRKIKAITPSQYIAQHGTEIQQAAPALSSWGEGGYGSTWTEPASGQWAALLLNDSMRMRRLSTSADARDTEDEQKHKLINHALWELMLAQASDWLFMLRKNAHTQYAEMRLREHTGAFSALADMAEKSGEEPGFIKALEHNHPMPPEVSASLMRQRPD